MGVGGQTLFATGSAEFNVALLTWFAKASFAPFLMIPRVNQLSCLVEHPQLQQAGPSSAALDHLG